MIKDMQLLKSYNKIWKKKLKIDFNTETTYGDDDDDKYIKTKIKTYKDSITTNFYNKNGSKKIPEQQCLSVIYAYGKYHPQAFLEERKYMKKNIKSKNYNDMELESECDTDIDSDSDNSIYIDIDDEEQTT